MYVQEGCFPYNLLRTGTFTPILLFPNDESVVLMRILVNDLKISSEGFPQKTWVEQPT